MCPGIYNDLPLTEDMRKTAIIDKELSRLNIDIACLQETRLADNGRISEANYTFLWQGLPSDRPRQHGVGFAIKNSLMTYIEQVAHGTERILGIKLLTSMGTAHILSLYAPTLCSEAETKDHFYESLDSVVSNIPKHESLYLLGDFNARVGADHKAWSTTIGTHGIGKMNDNGQRLLELCSAHNLCITNTFFKCKDIHKVSWRHPRSKHWHQLDLIITRRSELASVLQTRSYHSADCDTDHSLVASKIKITPRKLHHSKRKGKTRINTCHTNSPEIRERLNNKLSSALTDLTSQKDVSKAHDAGKNVPEHIDVTWLHLRETIYNTSIAVLGKKERKSADWFEANWEIMEPVTEAKRKALMAYKAAPGPDALQKLRNARNIARKTARFCANKYWVDLCIGIQSAADQGDAKKMYEGIKKATGPLISKSAPLKSKTGEVITEQDKQLQRWTEHYLELYATQNVVSDSALNRVPALPVLDQLDALPSIEELSKAIDHLSSGKAPGNDGIPAEVLKCGKPALLKPLLNLICECWESGHIPQDMRDAKIVTLYKNKGDRSDCNNYRGISLLSIVGKAFARVVLARLQTLAQNVYPESQCGFRAGRSTMDMVFSLRQLQEKCREQQKVLFIAYIDLTKAFDLVSRTGLFSILKKIGCPPRLLSIIEAFHNNMHSTVLFDGATSEPFPVCSGVKQGCVLAPTLFGIFFSVLLRYAFENCSEGVNIHTRADGNLYNIARLRAKSKVETVLIRELLFADDAALVSHTEEGLQQLVSRFSEACKEFGLTISLKKTNIMRQGTECLPAISIEGNTLDVVEDYTYLGSNISSSLSLEKEIQTRIGKAVSLMARLNQRVWDNAQLTDRTKISVYQACVLSTLLYGSETWATYAKQIKQLNSFHLRCLRRILHIKWQERVTNVEVLRRSNMLSINSILSERRLRWIGHVHRMGAERIPRALLYGELAAGTRKRGRPCLRFKDVCKKDLLLARIEPNTWESHAEERTSWRSKVREGTQAAEATLTERSEEKRARRKARGREKGDCAIVP